MVTAKQIEQKYIELKKELASVSPDMLGQFPMSDRLNDVESSRLHEVQLNFRRVRSRKHAFKEAVSQYGDRAVQLYFKLALCCLLGHSLERLNQDSIPNEIADLYHQWFETILGELSTRSNSYYGYRSISLGVDMRICSLTDIPIGGAWVMDTRRISLRPFVKGGIGQFFDYLAFAVFKCGGFGPYYRFHTARRYLRHFNENEMNLAYLRIAKLMRLNRKIKGIHTRGWFYDPQVEQFSPNLAYLRQVPLQNGAKLFAGGSQKSDIRNALVLSAKRLQLHKEGKYAPTTYSLLWPREEFLRWADKTNARPSTS